ncbi:unnamed protein product [Blepharisma stoltei]|uniref:BZIP domain-containing protein n=1 Tax=Blepharisma stoltei TaxID=1481888 RepID=A0AAU9IJ43_9CILI|nr:unnamed protein product [Blepharisma stoltei]
MTDYDLFNIHDLDPIPDYFSFQDTIDSFQDLPKKRPIDQLDESSFLPGTLEYKKARKKRQNRESASRSRARKKIELTSLDTTLSQIAEINQKLTLENAALKAENGMLKKELEFYKGFVKNDEPKMKGNKASTGWLAVSVVLSMICMVLVTHEEGGQAVNMGGRSLKSMKQNKFLNNEESNYSMIMVVVLGLAAAACAWKYFHK